MRQSFVFTALWACLQALLLHTAASDSVFIDAGGACDVTRYLTKPTATHRSTPGPNAPPALWSHRYATGGHDLEYRIPVTGRGPYTVRLYFLENYRGSSRGFRSFSVYVNKFRAFVDLDVVARSGGLNTPYVLTLRRVYTNTRHLSISLRRTANNNPFISAIHIEGRGAAVPGTPECAKTGRLRPGLPGGTSVKPAKYTTLEMRHLMPLSKPNSAIVVLHGMGQKPEDLRVVGWAARLRLPRTRFVFVRAPTAYVSYLQRRTRSWFNIKRRAPNGSVVSELRASAAGIAAIVRAQAKHGIPANKVVVVGLSQGGGSALTFYLAERLRIAGVIGVATWLPLATQWHKQSLPSDNAKTPAYILHGTADKVIRIEEARESVAILRRLGRTVKYKEYSGAPHDLRGFMAITVSEILTEAKRMLGV